jgi:hypothetical protein
LEGCGSVENRVSKRLEMMKPTLLRVKRKISQLAAEELGRSRRCCVKAVDVGGLVTNSALDLL